MCLQKCYSSNVRVHHGVDLFCLASWTSQVPELEADFSPKPNFDHLLTKVQRGQKLLGKDTAIPIVMGPITLILLAKSKVPAEQALERVLPVYVELLTQIKALGVPEVQIHEPILASDKGAGAQQLFNTTYAKLSAIGTPIDLVTYFDDIGAAYPWVVQLPVAAISLDFVGVPGSTAGNDTLSLIRQNGFPANKRLGAGVVDGRSVWADDKGREQCSGYTCSCEVLVDVSLKQCCCACVFHCC